MLYFVLFKRTLKFIEQGHWTRSGINLKTLPSLQKMVLAATYLQFKSTHMQYELFGVGYFKLLVTLLFSGAKMNAVQICVEC